MMAEETLRLNKSKWSDKDWQDYRKLPWFPKVLVDLVCLFPKTGERITRWGMRKFEKRMARKSC